ncbi:MAG: hypothetical protein NTZ56_02445 [Acidobacteria bacterium]|nr:hypothetical protein [Acidobacteriota bacterium]
MSAITIDSTLEAKAHELVSQLGQAKLAAVVQLLEVVVEGEDEPLSESDRQAVLRSQAYFAEGGQGIPFEQVVAECGFTMDEITGGSRPA